MSYPYTAANIKAMVKAGTPLPVLQKPFSDIAVSAITVKDLTGKKVSMKKRTAYLIERVGPIYVALINGNMHAFNEANGTALILN
jgi:hypothetical protein